MATSSLCMFPKELALQRNVSTSKLVKTQLFSTTSSVPLLGFLFYLFSSICLSTTTFVSTKVKEASPLLGGGLEPCLWKLLYHPLPHVDIARLDQGTMPQQLLQASLPAVIIQVKSMSYISHSHCRINWVENQETYMTPVINSPWKETHTLSNEKLQME